MPWNGCVLSDQAPHQGPCSQGSEGCRWALAKTVGMLVWCMGWEGDFRPLGWGGGPSGPR